MKEGLSVIGAVKHAELFLEGERLVSKQRSQLSRFLASAFFGKNDDRDGFNGINDQFYELEKTEDLEQLNSAWLKSRPGLCVVPASELRGKAMMFQGKTKEQVVEIKVE